MLRNLGEGAIRLPDGQQYSSGRRFLRCSSRVSWPGLYYLTNFAAPVAGYWLRNVSDRQANRLTLYRICAVLGGLGWVGMALATSVMSPDYSSARS
jgi:hypothetical protein